MTTWGDTTTLQSTILDEATVDDTTGGIEDETTTEQATTTEEVTTTEPVTESAETVKSSAIDPERDTRARPVLDVDLGLEEASGDNDSDY